MRDPESRPRFRGYEASFAEWAVSEGWRVTKRGWPDFICRRGDEVMAVEVKGGHDTLSAEQRRCLDDLKAAGLPVYVWWPERGLLDVSYKQTGDSIHALQQENARLHQLVQELVAAQVPRVEDNEPKVGLPDKRDLSEDVTEMNEHCRRRHGITHVRTGKPLTLCGWIWWQSQQGSDVERIAETTGLSSDVVQRRIWKMTDHLDRLAHHKLHKTVGVKHCAGCQGRELKAQRRSA